MASSIRFKRVPDDLSIQGNPGSFLASYYHINSLGLFILRESISAKVVESVLHLLFPFSLELFFCGVYWYAITISF